MLVATCFSGFTLESMDIGLDFLISVLESKSDACFEDDDSSFIFFSFSLSFLVAIDVPGIDPNKKLIN